MPRRTVALVLVVDLPADANTAALTTAVLDAVQAAGIRVPYLEAHDDLTAVLDDETADRWTIGPGRALDEALAADAARNRARIRP